MNGRSSEDPKESVRRSYTISGRTDTLVRQMAVFYCGGMNRMSDVVEFSIRLTAGIFAMLGREYVNEVVSAGIKIGPEMVIEKLQQKQGQEAVTGLLPNTDMDEVKKAVKTVYACIRGIVGNDIEWSS